MEEMQEQSRLLSDLNQRQRAESGYSRSSSGSSTVLQHMDAKTPAKPAAKPAPAKQSAGPLQQAQRPSDAAGDVAQKLLTSYSRNSNANATKESCAKAIEEFNYLREHFPDALTPRQKYSHGHCLRILGQYGPAKSELNALLKVPGIGKEAEDELHLMEARPESLETAAPPKPSMKAKKARASEKAAPADAYQAPALE
jgi:hypothetical protein